MFHCTYKKEVSLTSFTSFLSIEDFLTIRMAGYEWLKEELAVAVYYASEGVPHSVLVHILRQRRFFRTMVAIRNRLNTLRIQEKLGGPWSRWDKKAVDRWLDKLSEEVDVNGIITPTDADQQIVSLVSQPFIVHLIPANLTSTWSTRYCQLILSGGHVETQNAQQPG